MLCAACGHENSDAAQFCDACGHALTAPTDERRKVVTVLFCDVVGSTALGETTDPEAMRAHLARYFERMRRIVERHGGSVEKFIGDAVMAVFGVHVVHEDDALRACRAASEMRDARRSTPDEPATSRLGSWADLRPIASSDRRRPPRCWPGSTRTIRSTVTTTS